MRKHKDKKKQKEKVQECLFFFIISCVTHVSLFILTPFFSRKQTLYV